MAVRGDTPVKWAKQTAQAIIEGAPLTINASNQFIHANVAADQIFGVAETGQNSGDHLAAIMTGITKGRAGATITLGRYLAVQSANFINAVSGGFARAKCLEGVTSGAIATIQVLENHHLLTTSFA